MSSIAAPCRKDYFPAYHDSGERTGKVTLIVLHSTEGGTAGGVAHYFQTPGSGGSAHLVIDDQHCQRCLADDRVAWAAPGANEQGFHIEQCGYAAWTTSHWEQHLQMLHRVAYKIARAHHKFAVPIIHVTAAGLAKGEHGVTTHNAITRWQNSLGNPGTHTDPGPNYPIDLVLHLATHYAQEQKAA